KGYAAHEQQTLSAVIEARAAATKMTINIEEMTPEKIAAYQQAQGAVSSALSRLIALSESYPDLKANQNFVELQAQLEGTENRIAVAREGFNNATASYNAAIRRFPSNIIAGWFDFESKPYYEADAAASTAPVVSF
ncbi:MAG: LemA family protein, partial [Rikenellaceae bacterium]